MERVQGRCILSLGYFVTPMRKEKSHKEIIRRKGINFSKSQKTICLPKMQCIKKTDYNMHADLIIQTTLIIQARTYCIDMVNYTTCSTKPYTKRPLIKTSVLLHPQGTLWSKSATRHLTKRRRTENKIFYNCALIEGDCSAVVQSILMGCLEHQRACRGSDPNEVLKTRPPPPPPLGWSPVG